MAKKPTVRLGMTANLQTTKDFLLAAKRSEIDTLRQLMISCDLVDKVTDLIHELQRERGLSNTYLVSSGKKFASQRLDELEASSDAELAFRASLKKLNLDYSSPIATRIFSSIAFVLHDLDNLPTLREEVTERKIQASENTERYSRLIAGLLTVIFEAADISTDPDVTRVLVAMFNFAQGKEFSGQERAWGLIGFTSGEFTSATKEKLKALQDAQSRCLDIFAEFSLTIPSAQWRQLEQSESTTEFNRMRQMINLYKSGDHLPSAISDVWYDIATKRIDGMQEIAHELAKSLVGLCQKKIEQAEEDLSLHKQQLKDLSDITQPPVSPLTTLNSNAGIDVTPGVNVKLARSIFELVQAQAERLQRISEELNSVKQTLEERKLIDKAKGLLIQSKGITEEEAYKQLRQAAMDNNKRLVDVAVNVVEIAEMLQTK